MYKERQTEKIRRTTSADKDRGEKAEKGGQKQRRTKKRVNKDTAGQEQRQTMNRANNKSKGGQK